MADQAISERHHTKKRRPSRLRHEILPGSTGDDRDKQGDVVQEPNSDTIVLDTQPDVSRQANEHVQSKNRELHFTEAPLSPNSRATLELFGTTKKTSIPEHDTTLFKTFSKEPLETGNGLSLPPQTFSFGRPSRAISQTMSKIGLGELQPPAHATSPSLTKEENCERKLQDGVVSAITTNRSSQETLFSMQDARDIARNESNSSNPPTKLLTTDNHLEQPSHSRFTQSETPLFFTLPAQPTLKTKKEERKNIWFEKHRKGTKSPPIQPHVRPWPPRRSDTLRDIRPLTNASGTSPSESIDDLNPCELRNHNNQPQHCTTNGALLSPASHDSSKSALGHQIHNPNTQKDVPAKNGSDSHSAIKRVSEKISLSSIDILTPPPVTMSSFPAVPIDTEPCFVTNIEQQNLQEDRNGANIHHEKGKASSDHAIIPPESRNDTTLGTSGAGDDLHEIQHPPCVNENPHRPTATQPMVSREALHRISSQAVPSRVVKPRMKLRSDSKSPSHRFQGAAISPIVERAFKDLELTILAESFRKNHEYTTQLKHAEDKLALHLQNINLQNEVIADLRKQRDELRSAFENLTKKAKTNQKFLEGLQKDYEKLKRFNKTAQEDSKKVLHATISEIEEEKCNLRRELEMAACKLAESQRKIRVVADELYVKLATTHSANKSLTERLSELEEAHKSEKKQREYIESELMNEFRNLQRQFRNSSDALINKLEQAQTSAEKTALHGNQDAKIKECLEILSSLKMASLLTVKDVRKAEGMLCFVRTRVESGLEDLRNAISCNGPSNADLSTSINEQLQDLHNSMAKYEEVAAENYKIKESNFILAQQLEAQKQECANLIERVEHLKQVEIDLKDRSSGLERDLSSMKTATHSSKSEISAVEQTNHDLHRRLEEVEGELLAAKAKADDAENLRKGLEKQAAEYKTLYEATAKEQMAEKQNATTTREKLSEEFTLKLREKQDEMQNEVNRLKLSLQEKEVACQKLTEDLIMANLQLEELRKRADDQEDANNKLRVQVSEQQTNMITRQEADEEAARIQQEAQSMLQLTENRVSLLENERQSLLAELYQAHENINRVKRVEDSKSAEKDRLHQEIRDMASVIEQKDAEIIQIRNEFANEHQKVTEQCRNDAEDYKRRLAEATTSLKEAETNAKMLEDHDQAKILADQKLAESKLLELEKEYHNALQTAKEENMSIEQYGNHDTSSNVFMSQYGQKFPKTKGRKRVNRDNQSVIGATQEQHLDVQSSMFSHPESSQTQSEDQDLFAAFIDDTPDARQDEANGNFMGNNRYDSVPAVQDLGASPFSRALVPEKEVKAATKEPPYQIPSSSEFSSVASDELAHMHKEAESTSTSKPHGRDIGSRNLEISIDNENTGIYQADNASVASSHSSRSKERPRSQANTSSRMIPHSSTSKRNQPPHPSRIIRIKLPSQQDKLDNILQKFSGSASPEKRKFATSQTDSDLISKRQCGMSISQPDISFSGPRRRSSRLSRPCAGGLGLSENDASHTKGDISKASHSSFQGHSSASQPCGSKNTSSDQPHLSHQQLSHAYATLPKRHSSRVTRNKGRKGTPSGDNFNDRFDEELQGLH